MNTDTHTSGSTVKNHISLKTVLGYNVTRRTSFRSCPWFINEFFLKLAFFNIHDTFKAGNCSSYVFLKLVYFTKAVSSDSETRAREDLSGIDSHPVSVSSEHVEWNERGDPFAKPTKNPKPKKKRTTIKNGETRAIPTYRNGCKSSEKISWMTELPYTETHTPVLLMNHLWSLRLREVWIWVNTVLKLTSRKTETARSARGPKSQGARAEDALAESYFVLKILVNC